MVRSNFLFLKNIKFNSLKTLFFDDLDINFIFFKKINKNVFKNFRFFKIKKIHYNHTCINIIYF